MLRRAFAILSTAALLAVVSPVQQAVDVAHAAPTLPVLDATSVQASVLTTYTGGSMVMEHPLYSRTLGLSTSYSVLLPAGYAETSQRYPVLYMLHGVAGDSTEWQSIGLLEAADRMIQTGEIEPMLIVLPNGGANYWVNHASGMRWGDYLVDDVVRSVDLEYRTIQDPSARAVGGLSMGGEGALRMALLRPDVFGIAAAHSPSLRTAYEQLAPELQTLYGTEADWRAASPIWLVQDTYAGYRVKISLDVGEDDPWRQNVAYLSGLMTGRGIAHQFEVLPGEHAAEYWIANVDHYLRFYDRAFAAGAVALSR